MSLGVRFISIPLFYDKQISLVSNVPYVLIGSNACVLSWFTVKENSFSF